MNDGPGVPMSATRRLQLPLTGEQARALALGDMVSLDGEIIMAAGLPTHRRIVDFIEAGRPLPTDLRGAAMLHLASYSREANGAFEVLYLNPTTSTRFNSLMPKIISSFGLRAVGGKGGLDAACVQAMKQAGCVYLSFPGGGCTLLSQSIKEVVSVDWDDLIFHYRLVKLRVEGLGPATVAIDAHGNSLYENLREAAQSRLSDILAGLDRERSAG